MKKKINNKEKDELIKIVRSLISFIVIDGKELINEDLKNEYVKKYIFRLSKSMNGINEFVDLNVIQKQIEKDLIKQSNNQ